MNKVIFSLAALSAVYAGKDQGTWSEGPSFELDYDEEKQMLKIEVDDLKAEQYFSLGFGNTMIDVDMVLFSATGDGSVIDLWSTGF